MPQNKYASNFTSMEMEKLSVTISVSCTFELKWEQQTIILVFPMYLTIEISVGKNNLLANLTQ